MLRASSNGGYDMRGQTPAAQDAKARGDMATYLQLLGCPRNMAIRVAAHADVQRALPHADADTQYRVGEQRALINGYTPTAMQPLSETELRRRVAVVGEHVRRDARG